MKVPIVFIHGWSAHGGYFRDVQSHLPTSAASLCPDLPGHGARALDTSCHSIEELAHWLDYYLDQNDLNRVLLCGWSMGAQISLSYLERFGSSRVAGLVIEDMTPRLLTNHEWELGLDGSFSETKNSEWINKVRERWYSICHSSVDRLFAYQPGNNERTPEEMERLKAWAREEFKKNNSELLADFWESLSVQDFRPLLPKLTLPTLIISGAKSQLYSTQTGDYFEKHMPNARHLILQYSGHAPHMEQPAAFAEALAGFVKEIELKEKASA